MSVRRAMLALLSEGPKYGLRLRQEFEDRTGEVWPLNLGQVYTTLQRLERDGLVESDGPGEDGPGMTAVVVTHDAQLASWADGVMFLHDGRVTDQTAPAPGPLLAPGETR